MKVSTKFFGELEVQDKDIVFFEDGIPGFKEHSRYALIHDGESDFSYLQSVDTQNICFILVPPAVIIGNYDIEVSEDTVEKLEIEKEEYVSLYTILTIPEDINNMTANLKAPIVINMKNNKGKQEILDDDRYEIRHKVIKEADASC
ncbi:flagellar assembly protein FliW [Lutispora sp.]|uniref:flagellar assembly protein FliW n=1 Tax=Lutispora sp. TaxID=2828727 RepID=UPI00356A3B76